MTGGRRGDDDGLPSDSRQSGWKCRCCPSVGDELEPEISRCSSAVSAADNPVWIPASRAARSDGYHNEPARSEASDRDTHDFLSQCQNKCCRRKDDHSPNLN